MSRGNRISLLEAVKRRDPNITGVKHKISQKESQKIDFIAKVIEYALEHKKFSVIDLQNNLQISRNSLDRTVHLLLEKNMIILISIGLKNKKFYKIKSKTKTKQYLKDLYKWKMFKISLKTIFKDKTLRWFDNYQRLHRRFGTMMKRAEKINKFRDRDISYLESIPLHLDRELQDRITDVPYPQTVYLKSINATEALKIINKYLNKRLCDVCLKKGYLVNVINTSETEVACIKYGHAFFNF
jgi:hypothetical protein